MAAGPGRALSFAIDAELLEGRRRRLAPRTMRRSRYTQLYDPAAVSANSIPHTSGDIMYRPITPGALPVSPGSSVRNVLYPSDRAVSATSSDHEPYGAAKS